MCDKRFRLFTGIPVRTCPYVSGLGQGRDFHIYQALHVDRGTGDGKIIYSCCGIDRGTVISRATRAIVFFSAYFYFNPARRHRGCNRYCQVKRRQRRGLNRPVGRIQVYCQVSFSSRWWWRCSTASATFFAGSKQAHAHGHQDKKQGNTSHTTIFNLRQKLRARYLFLRSCPKPLQATLTG